MLPRVNMIRSDNADYLLFSTQDAISATIHATGSWAAPMISISRMFYYDEVSPLILDIGANLGAYCIPVAKEIAANSGVVYAFEPQRIVFYQLCGNVFLNRLDNVHAFMIAIGDADEFIPIANIDYAASTNIGGFSFDEGVRKHQNAVKFIDQACTEVQMSRLDSLRLPKPPCLIKIDVEGLELKVLNGGQKFLRESGFPPICLEAWKLDWFVEQRSALLEFLYELGYTTFEIGNEIIAQHPAFGRRIEFTIDSGTINMERIR